MRTGVIKQQILFRKLTQRGRETPQLPLLGSSKRFLMGGLSWKRAVIRRSSVRIRLPAPSTRCGDGFDWNSFRKRFLSGYGLEGAHPEIFRTESGGGVSNWAKEHHHETPPQGTRLASRQEASPLRKLHPTRTDLRVGRKTAKVVRQPAFLPLWGRGGVVGADRRLVADPPGTLRTARGGRGVGKTSSCSSY